MPDEAMPSCSTCPYAFPPADTTIGKLADCRRFPPPESGSQQIPSSFPAVRPSWICGEHPDFARLFPARAIDGTIPKVGDRVVVPLRSSQARRGASSSAA